MTKNSSTQASNSENQENFKDSNSKNTMADDTEEIVEIETKSIEKLQDEYIRELEAKLASLQKNNDISNQKKVVEKVSITNEYSYDDETIKSKLEMDDAIKVMSLLPDGWRLNLSTLGNGQGRIYKFQKFGETKNIRYGDLNEIINSNQNLIEAGRFYILNKEVIRHNSLDEYYSKIITKEKIDEILSGSDNSVEFYKSCNEKQQEMIISMLVEKIRDDPDSIDLNVAEKIGKISGVKIIERAEDSKILQEILHETK